MLSVGRPAQALQAFDLRPAAPRGLYRARLGALELLLVDTRNLARVPGTSFLRAFDHRPGVAARNLRELFHDPGLSRGVKLAIGGAVMKEPALWDPREHRLTAEELVALGEARGAAAMRRALVAVLERELDLVPRALSRAIEACQDVTRLERALRLALDAPDAARISKVLSTPRRRRSRG